MPVHTYLTRVTAPAMNGLWSYRHLGTMPSHIGFSLNSCTLAPFLPMKLVPLASLRPGEFATVREVSSLELQVALMNMGLTAGDWLEVANWGIGGDPLAVRIGGTKLSLSRKLAASILVERAPEPIR